MKKRIAALFAALFLLALLSGCRRELKDRVMTVHITEDIQAVFTGVTEEGVGEGTLEFDDWTYEGTFREEGLLSGWGTNYPWSLVIAGEELSGRYTGALEDGNPTGEGIFRAGNGLVFTGEMFGMAAVRGEAAGLPYTLSREGSQYPGIYNGTLENGLPSGEGQFEGVNAAGQRLVWTGGWSAGEPAGEGSLTADRLLTVMEGREQMGAYTGAGRDGLPEGEGVFQSVDAEGVAFTYTGAWHDGRMDGQGTLVYAADNRFIRAGDFTNGSYTPTWIQALAAYGTCEPKFTLTDARIEFLERHPELWEVEDHLNFLDSPYSRDFDRELTVDRCFDTPEIMEEPRWMCQYSLRVIDAVSGPIFSGGPVMTRITATESSYTKVIRVLLPGPAEGIYRGQRVHAYALPLGLSTYTTVLGEEKPCLLLLAGDLYNGP